MRCSCLHSVRKVIPVEQLERQWLNVGIREPHSVRKVIPVEQLERLRCSCLHSAILQNVRKVIPVEQLERQIRIFHVSTIGNSQKGYSSRTVRKAILQNYIRPILPMLERLFQQNSQKGLKNGHKLMKQIRLERLFQQNSQKGIGNNERTI